MSELSATLSEQLDLLIKYLGKESTKWAMTLKASNIHMPEHALSLIWERLDERFGSPEFVESMLKFKLAKFPKISQNQMKRLYDLSDILSEIDSWKICCINSCSRITTRPALNQSSQNYPLHSKISGWLESCNTKWLMVLCFRRFRCCVHLSMKWVCATMTWRFHIRLIWRLQRHHTWQVPIAVSTIRRQSTRRKQRWVVHTRNARYIRSRPTPSRTAWPFVRNLLRNGRKFFEKTISASSVVHLTLMDNGTAKLLWNATSAQVSLIWLPCT